MKAYSLNGINDLRYIDTELPVLQSGWVLVKVIACGICSSDIPRIYKNGTYHFPTIPGHEFSGIVVDAADKHDVAWIGKRVSVFPLIPCKKCSQCLDKHYEMCSNYDYIGSRRDGGFAEYVAVPVWNLIELDDSVEFIEAALFEPLAVALHCINQAELADGESVAISGSGAIAFAAGQWARVKGADKVCVIGRSEDKKFVAENLQLDYCTNQNIGERVFDVVIEAVGTNESLIFSIEHTKPGGKIVLMGNPSGDMNLSQAIYWELLRKQIKVIGTWNSVYDGKNKSEWTEVRQAVSDKRINAKNLITHRFDKRDMYKALELMKNHKEPYCKVMTLWGEV